MASGDDPTTDSQPSGVVMAGPLGRRLGRYVIEGQLGRGGIGVVYLAYDPELERRVALKVLQADDEDSRARLLREARAMARLTHPNVVTVFDVGTVDGRDFVTMELMDSGTLADWLAKPRRTRDIVTAFLGCGRGLAAAHAAGLVHRDVKPANILRAADGRFTLTDFGLARDHGGTTGPQLPRAQSDVHIEPRPPAALADVTATGIVLGTPSYMAPEQWSGNATPASDQFAFCVTMFEAFAGVRPYDSKSVLAAFERGPSAIDPRAFGAVPRRLRGILARGLEPDPAKRWRTMTELLAAIVRASRRPLIVAVAVASAVAVVAVVAVAAASWLGSSAALVATRLPCRDPRPALAEVWREGVDDRRVSDLGSAYAPLAAELDADAASWTAARTHACDDTTRDQGAELACLDGVAARLGLVRDTAMQLSPNPTRALLLGETPVDPAVCVRHKGLPPRLVNEWRPAARDAFASLIATELQARFDVLLGSDDDPCLEVFRTEIEVEDQPYYDPARAFAVERAAECGDERLYADALLLRLEVTWPAAASRGELEGYVQTALARVDQGDLAAHFAQVRADKDRYHATDAQIATLEGAWQGYLARHEYAAAAVATFQLLEARFARHRRDDLAAVDAALPGVARDLAGLDFVQPRVVKLVALWRWARNDLAGADGAMSEVVASASEAHPPEPLLTGIVVDHAGAPIAGARVVARYDNLIADAARLDLMAGPDPYVRETVTGSDGRFAVGAQPPVVLAAEVGDGRARSRAYLSAATGNRLVVEPTRRISGRVSGIDASARRWPLVMIHAADDAALGIYTQLDEDGRFDVSGVPDRPVDIAVADGFFLKTSSFVRVDRRGDLADVPVAVGFGTRALEVTAVSASAAAIHVADTFVVDPGDRMPVTFAEMLRHHIYAEGVTETAAPNGGLAFTFLGLPDRPLLACANANFSDPVTTDAEVEALDCSRVPEAATSVAVRVKTPDLPSPVRASPSR